MSHSVACHLIDKKSFEMILVRSLRNDDEKGIGQTRNIDPTLSEIDMKINFRRFIDKSDPERFMKTYNAGKYYQNEKELVLSTKLDN